MRQTCIGTLLSVFLCSVSYTQQLYDIKGKVVNGTSGIPLSGAYITIGKQVTTTDVNGIFLIQGFPAGNHKIQASFLGYANTVLSVSVPSDTEAVIAMYEDTTTLDEVVVNGARHKEHTESTSLPSYTISEDFMNENRENSLMQTLKKLPGISTIAIGSGQSKPVIRGLGFNRVVVVQNGIKHEAQQWGSDHGLEIDQYDAGEIEIIKGPASLFYGSDAIAGTVNIRPPEIPLPGSFSGEVNLLAENNNDLLGISAGVQARKKDWFYRARVTARDYGDYKVPTDKIYYENYIFDLHKRSLRNTAGREHNFSIALGYASGQVRSETYISNVNARNGFFANAHGLEVRTSSIDYDSDNRDIDLPYHRVNHFKITNNTVFHTPGHKLELELGYQNNAREEHSEPVPHGYMPKPDNSRERNFVKNTYSLNIRDRLKGLPGHDPSIGINAEYQNNNIGGWGFLIPEYTRFSGGIFLYDRYRLTPSLDIEGGIRYDYGVMDTRAYYEWFTSPVTDSNGNIARVYKQRAEGNRWIFHNFSASAGLRYRKGPYGYAVNLGKSFRMPLANELASDGVNYHMYRYEKGNNNLNPEVAYQLDLDLSFKNAFFGLNISPFFQYFDNYIYLNPTSDYYETLQIYEYNQGRVIRSGGEISIFLKPLKTLQFDLSGEYVYSRQTSGPKKNFTLPFSPPLSGVFSVSFTPGDWQFLKSPSITADYRMTARQDEIVPPERKTAGYQVLNIALSASVHLLKKAQPTVIRFKVNNLFHSRYFDHTSFYRLIEVPEAGRNLSLSLTQTFGNTKN